MLCAARHCLVDIVPEVPDPNGKAYATSSVYMTRTLRCESPHLPRKEVMQPHLPVQLPCYDFTPIAESTFDGSLPCGLGHRLRVSPTFVV